MPFMWSVHNTFEVCVAFVEGRIVLYAQVVWVLANASI